MRSQRKKRNKKSKRDNGQNSVEVFKLQDARMDSEGSNTATDLDSQIEYSERDLASMAATRRDVWQTFGILLIVGAYLVAIGFWFNSSGFLPWLGVRLAEVSGL